MINLSTIRNFQIPTDLPKFDLPKFDLANFEIPSVVEQPVARVAGAVRDVAYASAGLVVLATEKVTEKVTETLSGAMPSRG